MPRVFPTKSVHKFWHLGKWSQRGQTHIHSFAHIVVAKLLLQVKYRLNEQIRCGGGRGKGAVCVVYREKTQFYAE